MKLMLDYKKITKEDIYSFTHKNKKKFFIKYFKFLDNYHRKNCINYGKFVNALEPNFKRMKDLENFPMLPVNIFKNFDLISVPKKKIIKKMVSSGTSSNNPSRIFLDGKNSFNQKIALSLIVENFLGKVRLPMLIVDKKSTVYNSSNFTARSAAILGFSLFGKDYTYLLKENNEINYKVLNNFLKKYRDEKFFIFGFTSYVFGSLIKKLSKKKIISDFNNGILLHGGGWKKLEEKKISSDLFKNKLAKKLNLKKIHNYYGMIEQTGSIFIECSCGYYHTTIFSEVFIRNVNFEIIKNKKKGLVQLISLLPSSYPGHNIITEDIGRIIGVDDCKCGHKGKYFEILGRVPASDLRGCSDAK